MCGFIHKRLKRFTSSADPSHQLVTLVFCLVALQLWRSGDNLYSYKEFLLVQLFNSFFQGVYVVFQ